MDLDKIWDSVKRIEKSFFYLKGDIFEEEKVSYIAKTLISAGLNPELKKKLPEAYDLSIQLSSYEADDKGEEKEAVLTDLYLLLHKYGFGYSDKETELISRKKGLKWLPGGIMPVIFVSYLMENDFTFADLGAGNGIQGLLLQKLIPHKLTRLIEISESHLLTGRDYMSAMGIDENRVSFEHNDIIKADFNNTDIFYMYRPARPMEGGRQFYIDLADKFLEPANDFLLVSVADCFEPFIKRESIKIYSNEFLKIFYFRQT